MCLAAAQPGSARSPRVLGKDGAWGAKNRAGSESFGFESRRHGRRIVEFGGGLSPTVRKACFGAVNFNRIGVPRSGRFRAIRTTARGTVTYKIRGRFTTRLRAIFYVTRIEAMPALPPCNSGPVRFRAKFFR